MLKDRPFLRFVAMSCMFYAGYNVMMIWWHSAKFSDVGYHMGELVVQEKLGSPVGGFSCAEAMPDDLAPFCKDGVVMVREYAYCTIRAICPGSMFVGYDVNAQMVYKHTSM